MFECVLRALLIDHVVASAVHARHIIPPLVCLLFLRKLQPETLLPQIFHHNLFTVDFSVGRLHRTVLATTITVLRGVSLVTVDTLPENKVGREVNVVVAKLLLDLRKVFKEIK